LLFFKMDAYSIVYIIVCMKSLSNNFKLNDNVEFLDKNVRNWRFGKIIDINSRMGSYKIYSGTDVFWAREVSVKTGAGHKVQLETV
jgi:hypothetical protein